MLEVLGNWRTIQTTTLLRSARILKNRIEETCCHSKTSERPSTNASRKNSWKIIIIYQSMNIICKYKDLEIEINKWHINTNNVLVIFRSLGMIKKRTDKYNNRIPGSLGFNEIQTLLLCRTVYELSIILSICMKKQPSKVVAIFLNAYKLFLSSPQVFGKDPAKDCKKMKVNMKSK